MKPFFAAPASSASPASSDAPQHREVGAASLSPPPYFREPRLPLRFAALTAPRPKDESEQKSDAQRAGLRYEDKVAAVLEREFGNALRRGPWFEYRDAAGVYKHCQPDFLLIFLDHITIIECKNVHVVDAWWQLRKLYQPVVERVYTARTVSVVEVTPHFDPAVPLPEPVDLLDSIHQIAQPREHLGVYQCKF